MRKDYFETLIALKSDLDNVRYTSDSFVSSKPTMQGTVSYKGTKDKEKGLNQSLYAYRSRKRRYDI